MLAMKRFFPSVARPPGYQPVGMKPVVLLLARSTTAIALFPPLATKRVFWSALSARALQAEPKGRAGSGRMEMEFLTARDWVSMTLTVSEHALATYRVLPSREISRSAGW